jgi:gamma-glutamylcyclotransferase (GGCT)/AIG2-like uncharacterized protein YtfP
MIGERAMPGPELIFLYGTLMRPYPTQRRLGVEQMLEYLGPDAVAGQLHDLGPYPALVPGPGQVQGQVFAVVQTQAFDILDRFEGCLPGDPDRSEYLRELWPLTRRPASAWVYVFNRPVRGLPLVPGGDWAAHKGRAGASPAARDDFLASRDV